MTLLVRRGLLHGMVAHAYRDHPVEACGVLAGPAGSDRPARLVEMVNADASRFAYRFAAAEQVAVWRDIESRGERPVVIYHSHTATAAEPSGVDIACACEPDVHYVVISTRAPTPEVRSFRIVDGRATEEPVVIDTQEES